MFLFLLSLDSARIIVGAVTTVDAEGKSVFTDVVGVGMTWAKPIGSVILGWLFVELMLLGS